MADEKQSNARTPREARTSPASGNGPTATKAASPEDQIRALYEQAESTTAKAFDELVSKPSFGAVMARSAENAAALSRMGADFADLVLRNLRVAGRADISRLAKQLHRTEDKLERVLQEIEQLREELADRAGGSNGGEPKPRRQSKAQS